MQKLIEFLVMVKSMGILLPLAKVVPSLFRILTHVLLIFA